MKITWLGHAAFLLEGSRRVLIDPFLSGNPASPVKPQEVDVDVIAVTHGHGDHLGDAIEISKRCNAPVVCIHELSRYIAMNGGNAVGMNIGGTAEVKDVRFTMVPALHSADVEENGRLISTGCPAGFVVELDGVKVYHAGDTDVFIDMQLIGELHSPDVMLVPIGDWYTMGIRGAVKALELVKPKVAVPMHYGTFPVINQDPEEFRKLAEDKTGVKVVVLRPGEGFEYP
ncbi:metal-dependent hydrolase [Archaeoglobus veneficus]|uniref:UPF0173 metal-dependent hydrolase Arcve_1577 n=1 Tax=Archaeoglobus veneficus (strain DSM 11195 / SNP6) TaxID=693661 RepID=F2KPP9_ARCVS|nr:metal-dependent hydrolase [Archaeoglobus veneficus]AEA47577.1 UPF0173 metal-dependent hydrolase [Archaeoglobus veneficus SNP6]